MPKNVFVTGISGFLGSHIALHLLNAGIKITGSVRSPQKAEHIRTVLEEHGGDISLLTIVELDLLKDDGWDEAVKGHSHLIHTASPFVTTMPKDPQVLVKPAIEGTIRALNAGLGAKVKHIVLTSSMAAIAYGLGDKRNETLSEDTWTNIEGEDVSAYIISKTLAEKKAWEIVEAAGKKDILTVINPSFILGPVLENDIGTSGEVILKMLNGGYPGCPNMGISCIDVRDVAAIHISAMDNKELAGQRCIAAGQSIQMVELARILAKEFPTYAKKLPTRQLPDFIVRLVGLFDGDTRSITKSLGHKIHFNSNRAKKLLGRDLISDEVSVSAMAKSIIDLGLA